MKVFLSWSGKPSRELALALKDWLPRVLQVVEPFVSAVDIDKGDAWVTKLQAELTSTDFGIVCLTPSNLTSPWLHFEAGALGKAVDSRVCPVLLGVAKEQVGQPMKQLQITSLDLDDMKLLVGSLNKASGTTVPQHALDDAVDVWWPRLEAATAKIDLSEDRDLVEAGAEPGKPNLTDQDLLYQLLSEVRTLKRQVAPSRGQVNRDAKERISAARRIAAAVGDSLSELESDVRIALDAENKRCTVRLATYPGILSHTVRETLRALAVSESVEIVVDKAGVERVTFSPDGTDDELPF